MDVDYKEIGLACGLEIHQQLDTRKLFCNCRSLIIKDDSKPDKIIKRKLFARSSESGEKDLSADIEQKKNKTFVYSFYNLCNCLVESDSQPPFNINQEALEISMMISLMCDCSFVDSTHVMRKQVIDGSNVSGFQRTLMVSTDGFLDFDFGKVRVNKILLEEDSARPIKQTETEAYYSLDRQGTPLIEFVVWHDIHTPEDVKKVAKEIGSIFRRTCRTKRGLGSIRQDINISIRDGARVEIKGTQDLELIPIVVKREVQRQLSLIDLKKKLTNVSLQTLHPVKLSEIFKDTSCSIIKKALSSKEVYGYKLDGFKGILGKEVQPNRRVGSEIASILKKQTNVKGIIHLDELPNYGLVEKDILLVNEKLKVTEEDSFILVTCKEKEITLVTEIIQNRMNQFFKGVPEETRIITPEGNTEYQRPLSSGARMYPETDHKPIDFTKEMIDKVKPLLPKNLEEREQLYKQYGINQQLANKMKTSNYAVLFETLVDKIKLNPTTLAVFLLEDLKSVVRDKLIDEENISKEKIKNFFLDKNILKVPKQKISDVFVYFVNHDCSFKEAIESLGLLSEKIDLEKLIDEIINENQEFIETQKERSVNFIVGQIMKKTKGSVDAKDALNKVDVKLKVFLKNL